nr:shugoshin [Quercus suber]
MDVNNIPHRKQPILRTSNSSHSSLALIFDSSNHRIHRPAIVVATLAEEQTRYTTSQHQFRTLCLHCTSPAPAIAYEQQSRMARLNEPPAASAHVLSPTESVDACEYTYLPLFRTTAPSCTMRTKSKGTAQPPAADLDEVKRRFVRQNRELARNNSTQSLRIRNLEIEVGRLLTDNLDLREQVLNLRSELDRANAGIRVGAVEEIRDELKAKLAELGGLVAGLDDAVRHADPTQSAHQKGVLQGEWRERQPLIEAMRESQLPTINEDKLYPRRTLEAGDAQEMQLSDHNSNGSPELGSPPIAHFDYDEHEKLPSPLPITSDATDSYEYDIIPVRLSANLETRRSRKRETSKLCIGTGSLLSQSPARADFETTALTLRTGAKRKLADRDREHKKTESPTGEELAPMRDEDSTNGQAGLTAPSLISERVTETDGGGSAEIQQKPLRKVLGDKSTNISPRKIQLAEKTDKAHLEKPVRPDETSRRRNTRVRRVSSLPLPSSPNHAGSIAESNEPATLELNFATPLACEDLYSPMSSAHSVDVREKHDTPPPTTLNAIRTSSEESRPSRRARSAVNYAEPSLVAKMRRPGKELADAISGSQDPRLAISTTTKAGKSLASHKTIRIKREPQGDGNENDWTSSTLAAFSETLSPSQLKSTRGLGPNAETRQPRVISIEQSVSSAISQTAPEAIRGTHKDTHQPSEHELGPIINKMDNLDIYDLRESSSPPAAAKKPSHRRQSSVSKSFAKGPQQEEQDVKDSLTAASRRERPYSCFASMAGPPKRSGLTLYGNLLGGDATGNNAVISGAPVTYTSQQRADMAKKKQDVSTPTAPATASSPELSSSTVKDSSVAQSSPNDVPAKQPTSNFQKTTFDDFMADKKYDDVVYDPRHKRGKGGRNKGKNKNNTGRSKHIWEWNDIYDPAFPNKYEDFKKSTEQSQANSDWKARLYHKKNKMANKKRQNNSVLNPSDDEAPRSRHDGKFANNKFAPPAALLNFAPPALDDAESRPSAHIDDDDESDPYALLGTCQSSSVDICTCLHLKPKSCPDKQR